MTREVCFDTETTGIKTEEGHKIAEIACVEIFNMLPTGKRWHSYINPCRTMPAEAFAIHGLSADFLSDKPLFGDVVDDFLAFIGDDPLVAHNAPFDMGFINAELKQIGRPPLTNPVVDTLRLARKRLGATARASLDALCKRFGVDTSRRIKHEAMLDTELLAHIYLHLSGGPHGTFDFDAGSPDDEAHMFSAVERASRGIGHATPEELVLHAAFLDTIRGKGKQPIWDKIS